LQEIINEIELDTVCCSEIIFGLLLFCYTALNLYIVTCDDTIIINGISLDSL